MNWYLPQSLLYIKSIQILDNVLTINLCGCIIHMSIYCLIMFFMFLDIMQLLFCIDLRSCRTYFRKETYSEKNICTHYTRKIT